MKVYIQCNRRGDIVVDIKSPSGVLSSLLPARHSDYHSDNIDWTFMTLRNWGESPVGTWSLYVRNAGSYSNKATLVRWSLVLYGTGDAFNCPAGTFKAEDDTCQACDSECTAQGCTGPGPSECIQCEHYSANGICVLNCLDVNMANPEALQAECQPCHFECKGKFSLLHKISSLRRMLRFQF